MTTRDNSTTVQYQHSQNERRNDAKTVTATVVTVQSDGSPVGSAGYRCSLPTELAERLSVTEADHVRVQGPLCSAYYIVSGFHARSNSVRVGQEGRKRIGANPDDEVTIASQVPRESYIEARRTGGFAETLWYGGAENNVLITAPHGGDVEFGTDDCAMRLYQSIQDRPNITPSAWLCHGYGPNPFDQWHLSKPVRATRSYPGLSTLGDREFKYTVGLHMQSAKHKYVAVGGHAPDALRHEVAEALRAELPANKDVVTDFDEMALTGRHSEIVCNHFSANGGLHIEMYPIICYKYRKRVARAVSRVLTEKL